MESPLPLRIDQSSGWSAPGAPSGHWMGAGVNDFSGPAVRGGRPPQHPSMVRHGPPWGNFTWEPAPPPPAPFGPRGHVPWEPAPPPPAPFRPRGHAPWGPAPPPLAPFRPRGHAPWGPRSRGGPSHLHYMDPQLVLYEPSFSPPLEPPGYFNPGAQTHNDYRGGPPGGPSESGGGWPVSHHGGKNRKKTNKNKWQGVTQGQSSIQGSSSVQAVKPAELICKTCDKEYKMLETYQAHLQAHKKCDTCDFEAVPKVLREHQLLHLLPDELKFSSQEDIRKWREERRRNYPTAANVTKRKRSDEDKKARGEVAQTPLHRYINYLIGDDSGKRGRGRGRRGRGGRGRRLQQPLEGSRNTKWDKRWKKDYLVKNDVWWCKKWMEEGGFEERRSKAMVHPPPHTTTEGTPVNETQLENAGSITQDSILNAVMTDISTQEDPDPTERGPTGPQGQSTGREEGGEPSGKVWREMRGKVRGKRRRKNQQRWNKSKKRKKYETVLSGVQVRQPTLLEKLLAPEIRREQNAILQCIRHVVSEDFFKEGGQSISSNGQETEAS